MLKEREGVLNNLEETGCQSDKPNQMGTQNPKSTTQTAHKQDREPPHGRKL